jgi:hypothetical protein
VGGVLGLKFLLQTLHRLHVVSQSKKIFLPDGSPQEDQPTGATGALDDVEGFTLGKQVRVVFRCWVIVFALVGAQMSWVLRPFIGDPNKEFTWFRPRESHFFQAVWHAFLNLF